jgi:hypothetical protein
MINEKIIQKIMTSANYLLILQPLLIVIIEPNDQVPALQQTAVKTVSLNRSIDCDKQGFPFEDENKFESFVYRYNT